MLVASALGRHAAGLLLGSCPAAALPVSPTEEKRWGAGLVVGGIDSCNTNPSKRHHVGAKDQHSWQQHQQQQQQSQSQANKPRYHTLATRNGLDLLTSL